MVEISIKLTPSGGKVSIRVQTFADGMQIPIIDTGLGILSKDLSLLFDRFFRGTNAIEEELQGTGLGLFIVRSIFDMHKRKIQIKSE
ncbi:MAG: ATP-binding protein [Chloroflexota bacterium]